MQVLGYGQAHIHLFKSPNVGKQLVQNHEANHILCVCMYFVRDDLTNNEYGQSLDNMAKGPSTNYITNYVLGDEGGRWVYKIDSVGGCIKTEVY